MTRATRFVLIALGLLAVAAVAAWLLAPPRDRASSQGKTQPGARSNHPSARPPSPGHSPARMDFERTLSALQSADREAKSAAWRSLIADLRAQDPATAIAAIRAFLASGRDAPTGERFNVGERGGLESASSLRVALLDLLGQLSRETGSGEAAAEARVIFQSKKSADEWALALRNLAWSDGVTAELGGRFAEMIRHEPWIEAPSAGMAEALDVAVFARYVEAIPTLAEFTRQPRGSLLRRAGAMALDRLSEAAPLEVMTFLNAHPDVLADKPLLRADFYTKANLADTSQRAAVEAYLERGDVGDAEKAKFVAGLAAPGSFVTPALLSPEKLTPPRPNRRETLLGVASDWRASGRYPSLDSALADLITRKQ